MKQYRKNRVKALVLLVIFSLNTIAGFACSIGINMGYNDEHHKHGGPSDSHKNINSHLKGHSHELGHKHTEQEVVENGQEDQNNNDDCCANDVTKFIKLDKSVVKFPLLQAPIFQQGFISTFILSFQIATNSQVNSRFQFVRRSCSIYNTDIRITIQSFLI